MYLDSYLVSLDPLLFEAFLISSNNSKEPRDICPVVPAIQHGQTPATSKPGTLAGVTASMGCSMDVCPLVKGGYSPAMCYILGYWFHTVTAAPA